MGPNRAGTTAVGFAVTGVDDVDEVHIPVTIVIVFSEIHPIHAIGYHAGVNDEVRQVAVTATSRTAGGIRSVPRTFMGKVNRTYYVKVRVVLTG